MTRQAPNALSSRFTPYLQVPIHAQGYGDATGDEPFDFS